MKSLPQSAQPKVRPSVQSAPGMRSTETVWWPLRNLLVRFHPHLEAVSDHLGLGTTKTWALPKPRCLSCLIPSTLTKPSGASWFYLLIFIYVIKAFALNISLAIKGTVNYWLGQWVSLMWITLSASGWGIPDFRGPLWPQLQDVCMETEPSTFFKEI